MSARDKPEIVIQTTDKGWLPRLARAYRERQPVVLVDDAQVGLNPTQESLLSMGRKARLTTQEWGAVGISLGVAGAGVYLLVAAVTDPEPFSKLAFTIGSAGVLIFGGGALAIRVLTNVRPPNVRVTPRGMEIFWD